MWMIIALAATAIPIFLVIHLGFVIYVARQARQRGYSYWNWVLAGFMSNSIVFAVMLALLPDQSLDSRRKAKKELLNDKLRQRKERTSMETVKLTGAVLNTSIGDMATMDPEKIGMEHSIGDQATRLPLRERSLGDAATQVNPFDRSLGEQEKNL